MSDIEELKAELKARQELVETDEYGYHDCEQVDEFDGYKRARIEPYVAEAEELLKDEKVARYIEIQELLSSRHYFDLPK